MKQIIGAVLMLSAITLNAQEVKIGVISDFGESERTRILALGKDLQTEIQKTLGISVKVSLEDANVIGVDWDQNKAIVSYENLSVLCDYIILIGMVSTKAALSQTKMAKPTIALGINNLEIQGIPISSEGSSGIPNFSYILVSRDLRDEIAKFKELVDFKELTIIVSEKMAENTDKERALSQIEKISQSLNCNITPILIGDNVQESLKNIPERTDAVFLAASYEFNDIEIEIIANYLSNNKVPSYSLVSKYVDEGILMSISADSDAKYLNRKLAIMIDDVERGAKLSNLSVNLDIKQQLFLNMTTAREIDYSPSFQTLFTAKIVGEVESASEIFSLKEIINKALEENLNIKISSKDLELSNQDVKDAKSNYLPTLDIEFQGYQVNNESANELIGQSEKTMKETGSLGQLIYSEQVIANIQIQKLLNIAQQYATKQEINNVILEAYTFYFNVLFAKSNVVIQIENLEVLKKNLEMAHVKTKIGSSNNSDVFRWEAEVASATQRVIQAQTDLIITKTQLNTFLNNKLPEGYKVEDVSLSDEIYNFYSNSIIAREMKGPANVRKTTKFLTAEAIENYPARNQLNTNLSAVDRQLKMNKRLFYTPTVALGLSQSEILARGGAASEPAEGIGGFVNSSWNAGLILSYTIFDGTRRGIEKQRTLVQKSQLTMELDNLDNNLGLNVQAGLVGVLTSQTNIQYSEISAKNSWLSFELTQDYYRQGSVSVVAMFDAQNTALRDKLAYTNSVYSYILSFISLENTIGYYSMLSTDSERQNFENKYLESIQNVND